jgi:hypothetical protein
VLKAHEREKKKKYREACLRQHWDFAPFVASRDSLLGKGSQSLLKIPSGLAQKWEIPYSEFCGYVNARMSIAMVQATHLCLRGSPISTSQMSNRRTQWEDKAGLGLFQRYTSDLLFFPHLSSLPNTYACTLPCKATTHFLTPVHSSETFKKTSRNLTFTHFTHTS